MYHLIFVLIGLAWLETGNRQMKNAYKLDEIIYENQARNGYIQFKQIDLFADSETDKFKDSNIT